MKVVLGADVDGKELKDIVKNYLIQNGSQGGSCRQG